jgi:LysM repeat protein
LPTNWDSLVNRAVDRLKASLPNLLPAILGLLVLWATLWLLSPSLDSSELAALASPTASPTPTRRVVARLPTPTPFRPTATPEPLIHVVLEGEVLGLIAEEYGTTVEAILEANDLEDVDLISVGQELIIAGARITAVAAATHTPSSTSTPGRAFPYIAPEVLGPADQAVFRDCETRIVLHWASVGILDEGQWYEVRVWSNGQAEAHRAWTKATSWAVLHSLCPGPTGDIFYWDVSVVQRTGQEVIRLSPRSPTSRFGWH